MAAPAVRSAASASLALPTSLARLRYATHYNRILAPDLLYMTYDHQKALNPPKSKLVEPWDPANPYSKNRPAKKPKGNNKSVIPAAKPVDDKSVVRLEEIVVNTFVKEASSNKNQLLSAIAAFQAMTGQPIPGYASDAQGRKQEDAVTVVKTRKASASFKVRAGQVCGIKVSLKGDAMWTFLNTLVDLVLPRLKDWDGVRLPPPSVNPKSMSSVSGVVAFGLPPQAMALFPTIELNFEQYPRMHGFHVQFKTNQKGVGSQDHARALLSGLRIPFIAA